MILSKLTKNRAIYSDIYLEKNNEVTMTAGRAS